VPIPASRITGTPADSTIRRMVGAIFSKPILALVASVPEAAFGWGQYGLAGHLQARVVANAG
jgi:hypothetical protein